MWDEANCACGHEFSKQGRIDSIPLYFEAVKSAIEYSKMAQKFSEESEGVEAKYYDYEAQFGAYFANTYLSWMRGMAKDNFVNSKMEGDFSSKEVEMLDAEFGKIIDADFGEKSEEIDKYLEIYNKNAKRLLP